MTPLRQRMLEDMQLRNFSAGTQRSYIHYVEDFANYYKTSPARLGLDEIRNYELYLLEERKLSPQSIKELSRNNIIRYQDFRGWIS